MSSLADRLARAREVVAKAMPGPWTIRARADQSPDRIDGIYAGAPPLDEDGEPEWGELPQIVETDSGVYNPERTDADLIVLAVNALPALLDAVEAADRVHRAYLACCNEETACDADTDNFHGAAINLDAALARLSEVL